VRNNWCEGRFNGLLRIKKAAEAGLKKVIAVVKPAVKRLA